MSIDICGTVRVITQENLPRKSASILWPKIGYSASDIDSVFDRYSQQRQILWLRVPPPLPKQIDFFKLISIPVCLNHVCGAGASVTLVFFSPLGTFIKFRDAPVFENCNIREFKRVVTLAPHTSLLHPLLPSWRLPETSPSKSSEAPMSLLSRNGSNSRVDWGRKGWRFC